MQTLYLILIALFGLAIGSFLNVCIYRIPLGESVAHAPSHCPGCNHRIPAADLIPVFSYILLQGRCRFCSQPISPRYPVVELLNAVLYIILFLIYGLTAQFIFYALLSSILIVIAFIDFDTREIPDELVIATLVLGVLYHIFGVITLGAAYLPSLLSAAIGFVAASGVLYILALLSKGMMGGGDIKMMAAFGLCTGWSLILQGLFIGSLYGSAAGGIMMFKKKAGLKTEVPFGPFLSAGIFTILCFGDRLIHWYLALLGG